MSDDSHWHDRNSAMNRKARLRDVEQCMVAVLCGIHPDNKLCMGEDVMPTWLSHQACIARARLSSWCSKEAKAHSCPIFHVTTDMSGLGFSSRSAVVFSMRNLAHALPGVAVDMNYIWRRIGYRNDVQDDELFIVADVERVVDDSGCHGVWVRYYDSILAWTLDAFGADLIEAMYKQFVSIVPYVNDHTTLERYSIEDGLMHDVQLRASSYSKQNVNHIGPEDLRGLHRFAMHALTDLQATANARRLSPKYDTATLMEACANVGTLQNYVPARNKERVALPMHVHLSWKACPEGDELVAQCSAKG